MNALQIYVYGPLESGFIDVNADSELDIEALSEAFDEDFSSGEFSLPITIPWTDRNKKIFGFAESIQNGGTKINYWKCDVYDNYFPEMISAKMTLLEKVGKFNYKSGSSNFSVAGTKGLFGTLIQNKYMPSLKLGGSIAFQGQESRSFATDVMKGLHPELPFIAFAPVAIEDFFDKNRPDYDNEFLAKDTVNTVIVTGTNADDWVFGRPTSRLPNVPAPINNGEHNDYRTVPFFKVQYIIKQIFLEHGFSVIGDWVDDAAFADAYVFNNFSIEKYPPGILQDGNNIITPGNHVPNILIRDFLKGIFSFFNLYPKFINEGQVRLYYKANDVTQKNILSLNDVIGDSFDSTYQMDTSSPDITQQGYELNYSWDSADGFYSDRVKDLSDKTLVATVAKFSDLATLNIGRQLTTADIAYVQADNLYYCVADATTNPIKWDCYAEELSVYTKAPGNNTIDLGLSTLCTYVELNATTGLYEKRNYLGTRQKGTYLNNKNVLVKNDFGLRIFFIQKKLFGAISIPVSFNYNRDANNNKILPYSLALKGDDGVAKNFHTVWQDALEGAEIVKTSVAINKKVLTDINNHNVFEVRGVQFLLNKTERTIPMKNTMDIYLVPL